MGAVFTYRQTNMISKAGHHQEKNLQEKHQSIHPKKIKV